MRSLLAIRFRMRVYAPEKKNGSWEVFHHERGIKTEFRAFKEEDDACENFLSRIKAWNFI